MSINRTEILKLQQIQSISSKTKLNKLKITKNLRLSTITPPTILQEFITIKNNPRPLLDLRNRDIKISHSQVVKPSKRRHLILRKK